VAARLAGPRRRGNSGWCGCSAEDLRTGVQGGCSGRPGGSFLAVCVLERALQATPFVSSGALQRRMTKHRLCWALPDRRSDLGRGTRSATRPGVGRRGVRRGAQPAIGPAHSGLNRHRAARSPASSSVWSSRSRRRSPCGEGKTLSVSRGRCTSEADPDQRLITAAVDDGCVLDVHVAKINAGQAFSVDSTHRDQLGHIQDAYGVDDGVGEGPSTRS
jgi:hypothetical protein